MQEGREPQYSKSPSEIDSLESSPGIISDHIVPFLGATEYSKSKQLTINSHNQTYQEHKQNLVAAVAGIETDV